MKALNFICRKTDKNYYSIANNAKDQIDEQVRYKNSFQVTISPPKRSGQQLKGYWVLIRIVKDWMIEQGNNFTDEEVSNYFKIRAGHYSNIGGVQTPKSISNKSSITVLEMEKLLREIEIFGASNEIPNCYLEDRAKKEMLNWLEGKK